MSALATVRGRLDSKLSNRTNMIAGLTGVQSNGWHVPEPPAKGVVQGRLPATLIAGSSGRATQITHLIASCRQAVRRKRSDQLLYGAQTEWSSSKCAETSASISPPLMRCVAKLRIVGENNGASLRARPHRPLSGATDPR